MKVFLGIIIGATLTVGGYLLIKEIKNKPAEEDTADQTPVSNKSVKAESKSLSEQSEEYFYALNIEYPFFSSENVAIQDALNAEVEKFVREAAETFKKEARAQAEDAPPELKSQDAKSTLDSAYEIISEARAPTVLSVKFESSVYSMGAAHPGDLVDVINFDLSQGKVFGIEEVFKPDSDYTRKLSEISRKSLKAKLKGGEFDQMIDAGTSAEAANFKVFYPSDRGLVLVFNQYQVAPYAAGAQEVIVPYDEIANLLDPDSPLSPVVR